MSTRSRIEAGHLESLHPTWAVATSGRPLADWHGGLVFDRYDFPGLRARR